MTDLSIARVQLWDEPRHQPRPPYALWVVSFEDRKGEAVAEPREVFLRQGRHYRFIDRLARAVANPRVRWVNIESNGIGASRMVGR
jgi:hypothetical protein